ncbi:hypothetical protein V8B97DRAFT_1352553 [Scleroderma yunnanense]
MTSRVQTSPVNLKERIAALQQPFRTDDSMPPVPTNATFPTPRRNSLAVDFGPGRRVVSAGCTESPSEGVELPSPSSSPSSCPHQLEELDGTTTVPSSSIDLTCLPSEAPEPEIDANTTESIQHAMDLGEKGVEEEEAALSVVETQLHTVSSDVTQAPPLDTDSLDSQQDTVVDIPVAEENFPPDRGVVPQPTSPQTPPALPDPPVECPSQSPDTLSYNTSPTATEEDEEEHVANKATSTQPSPALPGTPVVFPLQSPEASSHNMFSLATEAEDRVDAPVPEEQSSGTVSIAITNNDVQNEDRPLSPESKPAAPPLQNKTTFKAVVHRKVTETPATTAPASSLAAPPTPQVPRTRRFPNITVVDVPPSTGPGELTILLEEAALLELRLTEGNTLENLDALSVKTPTSATFQQVDPRSGSATTLTEKPLPTPYTEPSRLSLSIPAIREPTLESEIPEIPEEDETSDGRSLASTTFSQRSPSHKKYLSGFRRLTGRRSSANMPGAYPRDSISLSSEDSALVATPPDSLSGRSGGFGIAWPSVSPKKQGSIGRASSFTDKLFNRSRTRSNVSTTDTDRSSVYETPQRSLNIPSPDISPSGRRGVQDAGSRPASRVPRDSCSDLSPTSTSSFFDKDIFDAFPSVPQTVPQGPYSHLDVGDVAIGRASTLPVKSRKHPNQRLSMM